MRMLKKSNVKKRNYVKSSHYLRHINFLIKFEISAYFFFFFLFFQPLTNLRTHLLYDKNFQGDLFLTKNKPILSFLFPPSISNIPTTAFGEKKKISDPWSFFFLLLFVKREKYRRTVYLILLFAWSSCLLLERRGLILHATLFNIRINTCTNTHTHTCVYVCTYVDVYKALEFEYIKTPKNIFYYYFF